MASSSLRSLISSPGHANMLRFFPGGRRPRWRLPFCEALFLRRVTPTWPGFSRLPGALVGAGLPAKPYSFVGSRQHAPVFPGRSAPMLAPAFLRGLIPSSSHANMAWIFPASRRPCWRRPPCEALFLRRVTPTCSGFSRAVAGRVGAVLPAKPYFFAGPRQHAPVFPGQSPPMLAPSSLRSFISSPGHANMLRFFPYSRRPCWRRPPCEALFLRRVTPTCSGFPGRSPPMLAPSSLRSLISPSGHTNTARAFPNSHFRILTSAYSAST